MVNEELVSYIKEIRKDGLRDEEIVTILADRGWPPEPVSEAFNYMADEADTRRRSMWWPKRIFYGRISRVEFVFGILLLYGPFWLSVEAIRLLVEVGLIPLSVLEFMVFNSQYLLYVFGPLIGLFTISLVMRRINDTGMRRTAQVGYMLFFGIIQLFLLLREGSPYGNEDGQPTKKLVSFRKLFLND